MLQLLWTKQFPKSSEQLQLSVEYEFSRTKTKL